jgi:hypothetical protein
MNMQKIHKRNRLLVGRALRKRRGDVLFQDIPPEAVPSMGGNEAVKVRHALGSGKQRT